MSWRQAAALLVRLAPIEVECAATRSIGFPALASAVQHAAQGGLNSSPLGRSFASLALQQHAEAAAAAAAAASGPAQTPEAPPQQPPMYTVVDRIAGSYAVQPKKVFAVIEVGGTQFKVTPDDIIITEKLRGVDVNDKLQLPRVLLLGSEGETVIGRPYVPEAYVEAAVEEQFLDGKVLIFHKRRRKNSRRLKGHRQPLTTLRILDVHGIQHAA